MRRVLYYTFLSGLLLTSASACTKEESAPQTASFFQVTQDGLAWQGEGTATYDQGRHYFTVSGSRAVGAGQTQTVSVGFTVRNFQTPYTITHLGVASMVEHVGGLSNQFFTNDSPSTPSTQITRLDTAQKIIEGRFDATPQQAYTQQPKTMRLTDGTFRIRYQFGPSSLYSTK